METNTFNLCFSEAKDHLKFVNTSIKNTRTQIFVLLAALGALIGFFSSDFFDGKYSTLKSHVFYSALLLANIELFMCRAAVLPARIDFDGGEPDILQSVAGKGDSFLQRSLLYSYQESINHNKSFLRQLASTYRVALTVLVVWLICVYLYCFYVAFPKG